MSNESGESSCTSTHRVRGRITGVPKRCWCGEKIVGLMSKSDANPYRRYYRCSVAAMNKLRNDNHVFKWVDEAVIEEIEALQLKNATLELHLKETRSERIEFEKIMMEKIEKEMCEKVEESVSEVRSSMKRMMILVVLGCMIVVGISKI